MPNYIFAACNTMNPIMEIFCRYFTEAHMYSGIKREPNMAQRTKEDFVTVCGWWCLSRLQCLTHTHANSLMQHNKASKSSHLFQPLLPYTVPEEWNK